MGLFGRKKTSVGLDIGSGYIKLAEVDHSGDRPEITRVAAHPIPEGSVADGEIVRPDRVAHAVRSLLDATGAGARDVVVALGGHDVFVKRLEMIGTGRSDTGDLIRREAERHIPFDIRSVQLDFQILRHRAASESVEVLLVAAKKDCIEARLALLEAAGAGVSLLDVEAFALCNGLCHNYPGVSSGVVALVDIGQEATNIIILEDGIPLLIRDLPLGLKRFGELLQRVYGLPTEWAEEVILGRRELEGLDRAMDTGADVVAVGIERASAFLGARPPGGGIGRVFVSGGGACLEGVARVLARRLKVETRVANPCERVSAAAGIHGRKALAESSPLFFQSIGLALRSAR